VLAWQRAGAAGAHLEPLRPRQLVAHPLCESSTNQTGPEFVEHSPFGGMPDPAPRGRGGGARLVAAAALVYCVACGAGAAAWQLPPSARLPRGRGRVCVLMGTQTEPGGPGGGDPGLSKAKQERSQIAALKRLGGVKARVRPSAENEDLVGQWVPSSWVEDVDFTRGAPALAPGTLVAVDCVDGYRRYAEVVGVSGLPFQRSYKVLESLSGKIRVQSPADVLLPTDSGLAKCVLGRSRVGGASAGAVAQEPAPAYTGTRAPTTTLTRPPAAEGSAGPAAGGAAPTASKRARLRAWVGNRTRSLVAWLSPDVNDTAAPPPVGGAEAPPPPADSPAVELRPEGHSAADKPLAKMEFTFAKLNAVEANWKQWGIQTKTATAKMNAVEANKKQWGIRVPSSPAEGASQRRVGSTRPAGNACARMNHASVCLLLAHISPSHAICIRVEGGGNRRECWQRSPHRKRKCCKVLERAEGSV